MCVHVSDQHHDDNRKTEKKKGDEAKNKSKVESKRGKKAVNEPEKNNCEQTAKNEEEKNQKRTPRGAFPSSCFFFFYLCIKVI